MAAANSLTFPIVSKIIFLMASYNDVAKWDYLTVPKAFTHNAANHKVKTRRITTRQELDQLLKDPSSANGRRLQSIGIHTAELDAPQLLKEFGKNAAKRAS